MTSQCDCEVFEFGDRVRSIQNPNLSGQIIGVRNWGDEYLVRLADGASTIWWHFVEIEHDPEFNPPGQEDDETNLVRVDFTKPRKIDENTTTGGAA